MRFLARDPDRRFQTARYLKGALTWALEQRPSQAVPRGSSRLLWRRRPPRLTDGNDSKNSSMVEMIEQRGNRQACASETPYPAKLPWVPVDGAATAPVHTVSLIPNQQPPSESEPRASEPEKEEIAADEPSAACGRNQTE